MDNLENGIYGIETYSEATSLLRSGINGNQRDDNVPGYIYRHFSFEKWN